MKPPHPSRPMNFSSIIFLSFLLWNYCIAQPPTLSPCAMGVGIDSHVCKDLKICNDDSDCEIVCRAKKLLPNCLVCTPITKDFLFKETVEKAGGPEQFDPKDPKVKFCLQMQYKDTIEKLIAKFSLAPGQKCDLTVQDRLLKYDHFSEAPDPVTLIPKPGRYVKSLKDRLESLELIAMGDADNSQMCKFLEFSYCKDDKSKPGYTFGECACSFGKVVDESCRASQFEACETDVQVLDAKKYPKSPVDAEKLYLPDKVATSKYEFKCGVIIVTKDTVERKIELECKDKKCHCPESETCRSDSTEGLWKYEPDPKYNPDGGTIDDVHMYTEALEMLRGKMVGQVGQRCSETHEKQLVAAWADLLVYAKNGATTKDGHLIHINVLTGRKDAIIGLAILRVPEVLDENKNPVVVEPFCALQEDDKGLISREDDTGVAKRYKCEKDPLSTISYCVVDEYKVDQVEKIYSTQLSQIQGRHDTCDEKSERDLIAIINQGRAIYRKNPQVKDEVSDFRFRLMELMRNHSKGSKEPGKIIAAATNLCNNVMPSQGLRCMKGRCDCGDDFEWSAAEKKCLVKIGRSCRECKHRKPFLPCTKNEGEHACVDGAMCLAPYGSPATSMQCIPQTIPKPATPFIRSTAATVILNSKLWISYFFISFF